MYHLKNTTYKRKYDLSIKNTTRTMVERKISSVKEGTTRMGRKRWVVETLGGEKNPAQKYDPPENKFTSHSKIMTSTKYGSTHKK